MVKWYKIIGFTLCGAILTTSLAYGADDGKASKEVPGADSVPEGQELVSMDFPEPTDIKDIIRAVAVWTGKNVILGKGVSGKVQMISPRKVTTEEAYQAFLSALNVLKLTTVETGKVIKIMPTRNAVKGNLRIYQGTSWAPRTDKLITQIVPLKYIDAKKLQTTLSRIVSTNSMIAYQPTNTLIISDTGYKVRKILQIISLLDVAGQQPKVVLVPIRYGDAKQISQKVSEILKAKQAGKKGTSDYRSYKISVDERSNSVVVFGPPRTIQDIKKLVKKFDFAVEDPANQASIRVRFLDYADAKKLASTLSSLAQGGNNNKRSRRIGKPSGLKGKNSAPASAVADLGDNVKITADESANALLITGSRSAYDAINAIVRKLDRRKAQVYVEADILDVDISDSLSFGTSILMGSTSGGSVQTYGWQGARMVPVVASQTSTTTDTQLSTLAAGSLSKDFTVGVLAGTEVDIPGLGKVRPGALITMLKSDGNSRVLSSPHLLTSNNETAKIVVGDTLFFKSAMQSSTIGAGAIESVQKEDADLSLEIKPNISHSGSYVTFKIDLEANEGQIDPESGLPDINKRITSQLVTVKNGQTAVISGLIKRRDNESYQKIPILGDIPLLGWLFRNSSIKKEITSLMIFLTPTVVYGANDLAKLYESKVKERDELLNTAFGYEEEDEFSRAMPSLDDGKYRPDGYDIVEEKEREKFLLNLRQEMGYSSEDIEMIEQDDQKKKLQEPVVVPGVEEGSGIDQLDPGEEDIENPPVPSDETILSPEAVDSSKAEESASDAKSSEVVDEVIEEVQVNDAPVDTSSEELVEPVVDADTSTGEVSE